MKLTVPSFDDDDSRKSIKKNLDKWEIELTTDNKNKIFVLAGAALVIGISVALLHKFYKDKHANKQ